jgi:hypothetical protein
VKLLAAAIDQSVSPGSTVCGTDARAEALKASAAARTATVQRRWGRKTDLLSWKQTFR